ncbi:unnamed protein product [Lepeophtheirus salmonis]|uniref:(salmon louse) hypothetical protein n=1 Tax=Lepeophtheirus salmonis TaxID=72036 RepID=A0A7R8D375_LEPSM|nr:unnamed protein product [Lepeophtheirus salmonis]CAF2980750.1 unnamed protein product [Lepeophtheirus salmonis]
MTNNIVPGSGKGHLFLELYRINMRSDILNAVVSEEAAIGWLQDRGLIPLFMTCECEKKCKVVTRNELRCYRCPRSSCRKVYSFRYGTCFEKSKINFRNNIFLMYYWSLLTPVSTTVEVTSLSKCTVIDRYNFFRSICAHYFIDHPVRLGGPGRVVEIGQSMFGEARYRKGRQQVGHWVLGGIERGGGDCFLIEIADRTAETLLPIIADGITPCGERSSLRMYIKR